MNLRHFPRFRPPSRLLCLSAACLVPLGIVLPARGQDLHPDWSRVWNRDAQPVAFGSMTVPADVVVPVTLDRPLSSASAHVGDIVTATPVSRVAGDCEFPPGTRIGGVVSQAERASGTTPGVLDVDFQSALLPDGTDVPLRGFIASLDSGSVSERNGHLIARDGGHVNVWKAVGVGGGAGFVLGRLLKTRTLLPTILGAAGAYLYARSKTGWGEDASIGTNVTLGVRLQSAVSFADTTGYAGARLSFLETRRPYQPADYGWNPSVCAPPRANYPNFVVVVSRPLWVELDPFDFYNFPFVPYYFGHPNYYPRYENGHRFGGYRFEPRGYGHGPVRRFGDGVPFVPTRRDPDSRRDARPWSNREVPAFEPGRTAPLPTRPVFDSHPRGDDSSGRTGFNPFGSRSGFDPAAPRPIEPFSSHPRFDAPSPRPRFKPFGSWPKSDSSAPRPQFKPFGSWPKSDSSAPRAQRDAFNPTFGRGAQPRSESRGGTNVFDWSKKSRR